MLIALLILALLLIALFGGLGAAVNNLFFIGLVLALVILAVAFLSGWGRRI